MQKIICLLFVLSLMRAYAQDPAKPLSFSGYVETYYSYDFGHPTSHERPPFFYSYNRHNEVNLNLGFAKANYNTNQVRGNFALMVGTYPQYNMAAEQGLLKNIFEANAGVKLFKRHNVWLDAGIMPSHIGFESAVGKDCWNLTRSILAENSPYYETGIKLGYTSKNEKLYLAAMYLNGWQRIQRIPANQTPAFGTQITYKPNTNTTLNWSTYIGNEQPDSLKKWRYFSNLYGIFHLTKKIDLITGFDYGIQQQSTSSNQYNPWYSPVLIIRYTLNDQIRIAARGEYYMDRAGTIITTGSPNGFQTLGYSLNLDYLPTSNVILRIEGSGLNSKDAVFALNNHPCNQNYFITTSMAMSF
ncbi:MAG: porin [Sphingobacteriaceae bacterium]